MSKGHLSCNKEAEIAVILNKVEEIHREVMGNGRPGLIEKVNKMQGAVTMLKTILIIGTPIFIALMTIL